MALSAGTRIGACEVIGPLGSGGMGEVYRGRDTKLNREVAIKTIPDLFASDPERVARFEREAQLLAALNHPHIAQVYGVSEEPAALIMELVPGESLAEKLRGGAVPLREALAIARQVADALEAAHEKGIIHRDLKPGNVMLTPDGQVKVLDFGLARMSEQEAASNPSQSPTLTFAATQVGVILGTAAYMSPEQAKGRVADRRSDVWAFGCLLYELLTGTRAFGGEDISDTLAAVLRAEPDWTKLPAATPPRLVQLLHRCLEKDRRQRIPDISVARYEIEHALTPGSATSAPPSVPQVLHARRPWLPALVAAAATAAAGASLAYLYWPKPPAPRVLRFDVRPPTASRILNRTSGSAVDLAISRDGAQIAYRLSVENVGDVIALRRLDQPESTILPGTVEASSPAFSPDGQALAFFANGQLKVLTLDTSAPAVACDAVTVAGLDWIDNETVVFSTHGALMKVSRVGGAAESIVEAEPGTTYRYPEVTDDGRVLLFTHERGAHRTIVARSLRSGEQKVIADNATFPKFIDPDYLVFMRAGRLASARFDAAQLKLAGNPVALDEGIIERLTGNANFDISSEGTFVSLSGMSMPYVSRFAWFARDGSVTGRVGNEELPYPRYPRLSPDGSRLVGTVGPGIRGHLWVYDLLGGVQPMKLTSAEHNVWPTWMPDGKTVVFGRLMIGSAGAERARQELLTIQADGSTPDPRLLMKIGNPGAALSTVSPDGRWLLFSEVRTGTASDLMLKPLSEPGEARPWLADTPQESEPAFSPDGKWVAYTSTHDTAREVWVRPFPGPGAPVRVSPNGGREPVWGRNGKELFYQEQGKLMAAAVTATQPAVRFATAVTLFEGGFVRSDDSTPRTFDVAPNGRFLMIERKANPSPSSLNVVTGWGELLKAKIR